MASERQVKAAKQNVEEAQKSARRQRTLASLPRETRRDLGRQAAKARARGGAKGHALEDRSREQIYAVAKDMDIKGRSKMGKWDLVEAIRARR